MTRFIPQLRRRLRRPDGTEIIHDGYGRLTLRATRRSYIAWDMAANRPAGATEYATQRDATAACADLNRT